MVTLYDLVISKKNLVDTCRAIGRLPQVPKPDEDVRNLLVELLESDEGYSELLTTFEFEVKEEGRYDDFEHVLTGFHTLLDKSTHAKPFIEEVIQSASPCDFHSSLKTLAGIMLRLEPFEF